MQFSSIKQQKQNHAFIISNFFHPQQNPLPLISFLRLHDPNYALCMWKLIHSIFMQNNKKNMKRALKTAFNWQKFHHINRSNEAFIWNELPLWKILLAYFLSIEQPNWIYRQTKTTLMSEKTILAAKKCIQIFSWN